MTASYLQNIVQQVRVGNYLSDELSTASGVPQGSVVGPLFFLIFIDDLTDFCTCAPFLFADDLKLATSSMFTIQNDWLSLLSWSKNNKLDFNFKKNEFSELQQNECQWWLPCSVHGKRHISWKREYSWPLCHRFSKPDLDQSCNSKIANCYQRLAITSVHLTRFHLCFGCLVPEQRWFKKAPETPGNLLQVNKQWNKRLTTNSPIIHFYGNTISYQFSSFSKGMP